MTKEAYEKILEAGKRDLLRQFDANQLAAVLIGYMVVTQEYIQEDVSSKGLEEYHENAKRITGIRSTDLNTNS